MQASSGAAPARQNAVAAASATYPRLTQFLEACKQLGEVRIIATNAAAVMEAIATLDGLFYADVPGRGMYANVVDHSINLDLHLRLPNVRAVRFEQGTRRGNPPSPTYILRFLGHDKEGTDLVLSLFLSPVGEVPPERVERWMQLRQEYATLTPEQEYVCAF